MNTTQTPRKIKLNRMLPGWYSFNSENYAHSFDIIQQGALWSVRHTVTKTGHEEVWMVENLKAARDYIAGVLA